MQLSWFLFHYQLTPQSTTGLPPSELLLGRRPRSHFDLAKPDLHQRMEAKQTTVPTQREGKKESSLGVDSAVFIKNFCPGQRWLPGTITRTSGPKSFLIVLYDSRTMRRHVNLILHRDSGKKKNPVMDTDRDDWTYHVPTK